jgi:pilus assembly protein CpaE
LKFLRTMFSYVIVDASSALTDVVLAAMDASDLVVLITTQEIPAIKNARLFLDLADVLGIERRRIIFVMNRYDKRIGITPEKVGESFKHEISVVVPFEDRVVVPSVNRGVPFMLGDRTRVIAKSILSLAEVVRQRLTEISADTTEKVLVSAKKG